MTVGEWDSCRDAEAMVLALRGHGSPRRTRLLAVACIGRLVSYLEPDARVLCDEVLNEVERRADAFQTNPRPDVIAEDYDLARSYAGINEVEEFVDCFMMMYQTGLAGGLATAALKAEAHGAVAEAEKQTHFIRCIIGNPFRPVAVDPSWLTSTVVALARGIYAERAFDRLPILADALQDAGCDSDSVLSHCRDAGPHARGCWVADLLLGKA